MCVALRNVNLETECGNKKSSFDLGDKMPSLLDLRFADDILLFARVVVFFYTRFGETLVKLDRCSAWCQPVVKFDAAICDLPRPHRNKTIWRALPCTKCSYRGATGIFLAYEQWTSAETTGGIITNGLVAWSALKDQRTHTPGSPTSFSNCINGVRFTLTYKYCVTN